MAITQAQMRLLQRRRTSDTDRLAQQYKKNVESLTGDYQSSFNQYQQKRSEAMAPFEAEFAKYKTDAFPAYEQQMSAYKQRLSDYQTRLADVSANPLEEVNAQYRGGRGGPQFNIGGNWVAVANLPGEYSVEGTKLYRERKAGDFTEKAPVAPAAPVAPKVEDFDASQFEQRKAALETDFKREVGERKSGRMAAVSRRSARPMLKGA